MPGTAPGSVRRAGRPDPSGDPAAPERRRQAGARDRRHAADQPPGRLAPPAPPEGRGDGGRGGAGEPPDLPPPRTRGCGRSRSTSRGSGATPPPGSGCWPRTPSPGPSDERAAAHHASTSTARPGTRSRCGRRRSGPGGRRPHREREPRRDRPRGRPGGQIYETSAGVKHAWGEVTVWEPPRRLAYLWHLGRDRADGHRGRDPLRRRGRRPHPHRDRAQRLGAPGRRRRTRGVTATAPAGTRCCRTSRQAVEKGAA